MKLVRVFSAFLVLALVFGTVPVEAAFGPILQSISPNSVVAGSGSFTLVVRGYMFDSSSRIVWNGKVLDTRRDGSRELRTTIHAFRIASPGTAAVAVLEGRKMSRPEYLVITPGVNPLPLSVVTSSLPSGITGSAYSASLSATGGTQPYSWNITSGSLPAGLSLSASGVISGSPSSASTSSFTVRARDAASAFATSQLSIQITSGIPTLVIASSALPSGRVGQSYQASVSASGGTTPYTWRVSSGSLPAGLSISTAGQISGTPTATTSANFTVEVKDALNVIKAAVKSIQVLPAPLPLAITTSSLPSGRVALAYQSSLVASGGTAPYTWLVNSGALPAGLSLSAAGLISGTPTQSGVSTFVVQAKDAVLATITTALSINVNPASAPSLSSVSPMTGPTAGGTTLTLAGSNFVSGATVKLDGVAATSVVFVSATQLRANTPAHVAAVVTVLVTNPDGQTASVNGFTYTAPAAPSVSAVSPNSGSTAGGTAVSISGASFQSGATVRFANTAATNVTFVSASQINATSPANSAGTVSVSVTNPGGVVATLSNAFTFTAPSGGGGNGEPLPTKFWINSDFEDGSRGGFGTHLTSSSNTCNNTAGVGIGGSRGIKCTSANTDGAAGLRFSFSNSSNPAFSEPNGLYKRWAFRFEDIAATRTVGGMKLELTRSENGAGRWPQVNVNYGGGGRDEFYVEDDLGGRADGSGLSGNTGFILKSNEWVCVQEHNKRTSSNGRARIWLDRGCTGNWVLYIDYTKSGAGGTSGTQWWEIGQVWTDGRASNLTVYIDDVGAANGWIGGTTAPPPPPPPVVDVCPNIAGDQATIPDGMIIDAAGNCVTPTPPPATDVCPNIAGDQETIPAGMIIDAAGNCVPFTPPPSTGAPAPGPNDPILFSSTFESGLGQWDESGSRFVSTTCPAGRAGNCLRSTTGGGGNLNKWFTGQNEVYFRFYFNVPSSSSLRTHLLVIFGDQAGNKFSGDGKAAQKPNGSDYFYAGLDPEEAGTVSPLMFYDYYANMNFQGWGEHIQQSSPKTELTVGVWHEIVVRVKLNTIGQSNGLHQAWQNGVLILDKQGMIWSNSNALKIDRLSWQAYTESTSRTLWADDFIVWAPAAGTEAFMAEPPDSSESNGNPSPDTNDLVIFQDDFESGDLSKWDDVNASRYKIEINSARVKSGARSLRGMLSPANSSGELNKWYMPGYDEVFVKFNVQFQEGFESSGMQFLAQLGNHIHNKRSASDKAGVRPSGSDFFASALDPEVPAANGASAGLQPFTLRSSFPEMICTGTCSGDASEPSTQGTALVGGRWHEVVFRVKANTPGQSDGEQTVWIDGVKRLESRNIRWRDTTDLRLNQLSIQLFMRDGAAKTQNAWFDNILVWSPR